MYKDLSMTLKDFLMECLNTSRGDLHVEVRIDSGIPIPFEDVFEIIYEKGFFLFRAKKGDEDG